MQNKVLSDIELIELIRQGDESAEEGLCERYKPLVLKNSKTFFLAGGEADDLIQEGMIGLFYAIKSYSISEGAPFFSFADLCIRRQMMKAIDASNTKKNAPLNNFVSIEYQNEEGNEQDVYSIGISEDPADIYAKSDATKRVVDEVRKVLSSSELMVFDLHLEGKSYREIAQSLDKDVKFVDNAIQRIRLKARPVFEKYYKE